MARAQQHPAYEFVRSTELLTEAWLAAGRARLSEARRLARAAADFAREHDQFARELWCLQTAVQFDDMDAAGRLAELAAIVEGPRAVVAARYATALSADDAVELDQVSAEFEAMGDRLAAADAAGQAATTHRRAGRAGSAITSAARAGRLAAESGGATTPAIAAASFPLPFSHREHEVAMLVAQGLSNRDIAAAVSLSIRTVEGYIYSACNKVGVKGRADLAELMHSVRR
jgi:DNA-binding CsgD family transcriptional regulator